MQLIIRAPHARLSLLVIALLALVAAGSARAAQQRVVANLPDAPTPKQETGQKAKGERPKMGLGILAKRSLFFPDLAHSDGPLTSGQKFLLAVDESIAPAGLIVSAATAGISQANDSWAGYGQGGSGYGKRFGATLALNASTDMFGTFLLPSVLHHDPRYFVLAHGSTSQKLVYALKRVVVTRTDDGGEAINVSGLLGPLAAEGLANSYLPDAERTAGQTFERFGIQLAIIAGGNVAKEFWPVIFKTLRIGEIVPGAKPKH